MLGHPILVTAEGGGYAQGKALFAEQDIAAVAGVNGHDGVILGEVDDVSFLGVELGLGVQTLDVICAVADSVKNVLADAGHNSHGHDDINAVGKLDAVLCKVRADNAHGVRYDIHRAALHRAVIDAVELFVHLLGIHPIVRGACVLLLAGADEGAILNTGNVVRVRAVQVAAGELFLVELYKLARAHRLVAKLFKLLFRAVYPDYALGLTKCGHFLDPLCNVYIVCQVHQCLPPFNAR